MTTTTTGLDDRIIESAIGALEMYSIHLGRQLNLYAALDPGRTARELAGTAGIAERYAREWLEQQAVAGFVDVDDPAVAWDRRTYSMNPEQRAVLLESDDPAHVSPLADMLAGVGGVIDEVANAYRSGAGVPYRLYGARFRSGQGEINRPAFVNDLAEHWLQDIDDVTDRLRAGGGRIADLGCGTGWSTIALAKAFPKAQVWGYDLDEASISDAAARARHVGVNAQFSASDAAAVVNQGPFDLIFIGETLHDLADPERVLGAARKALAADGAVIIADEKVAEQFVAPGDELERMMFGWSVVHCLPASLAEEGSAALGTVLRPGQVRLLARESGFGSCEVSDADGGFFNIYVLRS